MLILVPEKCELDIGMLVDMSGSITEYPPYMDNWIQLRNFLNSFIKDIKAQYPDVNLALETFRNQGNVKFHFGNCSGNSDVACMQKEVWKITDPVCVLSVQFTVCFR